MKSYCIITSRRDWKQYGAYIKAAALRRSMINNRKGIYLVWRPEFNGNCNKQASLLMIVYRENRHYTTIKNLWRLLKSLIVAHKGAY